MFRNSALVVMASLLLCNAAAMAGTEAPAPTQMQHIVVKYVNAQADPNSFGAQPRDYLRAGTRCSRVAEAADPTQKIHQLIIMNLPDAWQIELYSKQGVHIAIKSVHCPIFPGGGGAANAIRELEFGQELEFFRSHGAKKTSVKKGGVLIDEYVLPVEGVRLVLDFDPASGKPLTVAVKKGDQALTIAYITYETLPFNASDFKPPAGIKISDVKTKAPVSASTGVAPTILPSADKAGGKIAVPAAGTKSKKK